MTYLFGTIASAPVGAIHDISGRLMAVVILVMGLVALAASRFGQRRLPALAQVP